MIENYDEWNSSKENKARIIYNVGDYVLLYGKKPAIIINFDDEDTYMPYLVNMFTGTEFVKIWMARNKIIRKLNSKEINSLNSVLNALKFNL